MEVVNLFSEKQTNKNNKKTHTHTVFMNHIFLMFHFIGNKITHTKKGE